MRCLAVTRVLQVTEDHERHRVTPQIAPIDRAGAPPVPLGSAQICPAGAIRSGTGGRASQPGAAFIATINLSKVTRLSCSFQGTTFLLRIDPLKRLNRR